MDPQPAIQYDFLAPRKILFGWGRRRELAPLVRGQSRRCFLVWGSRTLAASSIARAGR